LRNAGLFLFAVEIISMLLLSYKNQYACFLNADGQQFIAGRNAVTTDRLIADNQQLDSFQTNTNFTGLKEA